MTTLVIGGATLILMGGIIVYLKVENNRLIRENRQACSRESESIRRIHDLREQLFALENREKARDSHHQMMRDERIDALKAEMEALHEKHREELEQKQAELRNKEMLIATFKKQIDRLSGWEEIEKGATKR